MNCCLSCCRNQFHVMHLLSQLDVEESRPPLRITHHIPPGIKIFHRWTKVINEVGVDLFSVLYPSPTPSTFYTRGTSRSLRCAIRHTQFRPAVRWELLPSARSGKLSVRAGWDVNMRLSTGILTNTLLVSVLITSREQGLLFFFIYLFFGSCCTEVFLIQRSPLMNKHVCKKEKKRQFFLFFLFFFFFLAAQFPLKRSLPTDSSSRMGIWKRKKKKNPWPQLTPINLSLTWPSRWLAFIWKPVSVKEMSAVTPTLSHFSNLHRRNI